jgi:chromosome segregation ATPase
MSMFKKKDEDRKPIEQEIAELQRKFRVLENDKRACSEDSQGTIRKQRATIEKLTRENRKMKGEMNETRSASVSGPGNKMNLENLSKLNEQVESLLNSLQNEDDVNIGLQDKVDATQRHIFSLRQEMAKKGGVNAAMDNAKAVQKQIRILENRLDQGLIKFNEAVTANRGLREQIDTLRRERVVFDDIYRKLENELQQKKREMAFIIEQANAAYEARDSAQAQMASLKQQADKEHAEFEKEWRELGRLIENDKRMKEFMRTKSRTKDDKGQPAMTDEERQRKKINKNAHDTAKSLATLSGTQEKTSMHEESFARIQAATGICDIDELVTNFVNVEDTNFTLFKYNNELTADIKKLEEQIVEYKEEYITLSGNSNKKEDIEKTKLLESLEEKWNEIDKKAIHYEVKYLETQQTLSHARAIIESLFAKIGATEKDLPNGCGGGIDESNMNAYLAVIEGMANELMKTYQALKEEEDDDAARPPRQPGASSNLQIKLPSTVEDYSDDEEDDDEDDQRPFTREELKTKTMRGISKRQKKTKAKGGAVDK